MINIVGIEIIDDHSIIQFIYLIYRFLSLDAIPVKRYSIAFYDRIIFLKLDQKIWVIF